MKNHPLIQFDRIGNRKRYREGDDPNLFYCTNNLNQYTTTDDTTDCPPSAPVESFAYDTDGNLTGDGGKVPGAARPDGTPRKFTWDAENRLIRVEPANGYSPVSSDVKVEFRYDYMGLASRRLCRSASHTSRTAPSAELLLPAQDVIR